MNRLRVIPSLAAALLILFPLRGSTAPTVVHPGFNLFTPAQDVEIGRLSAAQAERQIPMLPGGAAERYVSALGARLAAQAPGPRFSYRFAVVNRSDINAFALPGGYVYVNRGLLEHVRNEGELAGVMAHEIAHVALRHPTNQLSRAYLGRAGIGLLGGLLGNRSSSQIVGALGGFGLNALFLKFSRTMESQADIVGAQIMQRAGYDPTDLARFFSLLGQQAARNPDRVAVFLSDHPAPADREARVRQEAAQLGAPNPRPPVGSLAVVQTELSRLAAAPSGTSSQGAAAGAIDRPSTRYRVVRQRDGLFQLEAPDNWSMITPSQGYGVTLAPRGGVVPGADGRSSLSCGLIVNHYVPFDGMVGAAYQDPEGSLFGSSPLEQASSDLVRQLMRSNPSLRVITGSQRRRSIDGQPAFSVRLSGSSGGGGNDEAVTVLTRELPDRHIVYLLMVVPARDEADFTPAFQHMAGTLRVNESLPHP